MLKCFTFLWAAGYRWVLWLAFVSFVLEFVAIVFPFVTDV